jgi:redox-sensitive bicupin YhaK (pirin superfamily)
MSAGTGIQHSEFNNSRTDPVNFLQLWIIPKLQNIEPRYHQKLFSINDQENTWQVVVSPDGEGLWINQDAYISRGQLAAAHDLPYQWHKNGNGIYLFLISGEIEIDNHLLKSKDAIGVWDTDQILLTAKEDSQILVIEVPMNH